MEVLSRTYIWNTNLWIEGSIKIGVYYLNELYFISPQIMRKASNPKTNKIASFAKGLNSIPAIITTFLISPYVLGWLIPRFTYANTRRLHAEAAEKDKTQTTLAKSA